MPAGGGGGQIKLGVTEAESNWVEPAARGRRGPTVASEISAPPRQGKSWSRPWVGGGDQGDLSWSLFFFFFLWCGACEEDSRAGGRPDSRAWARSWTPIFFSSGPDGPLHRFVLENCSDIICLGPDRRR
jgi:hypothetical protein